VNVSENHGKRIVYGLHAIKGVGGECTRTCALQPGYRDQLSAKLFGNDFVLSNGKTLKGAGAQVSPLVLVGPAVERCSEISDRLTSMQRLADGQPTQIIQAEFVESGFQFGFERVGIAKLLSVHGFKLVRNPQSVNNRYDNVAAGFR
jgi:hypothetical protein